MKKVSCIGAENRRRGRRRPVHRPRGPSCRRATQSALSRIRAAVARGIVLSASIQRPPEVRGARQPRPGRRLLGDGGRSGLRRWGASFNSCTMEIASRSRARRRSSHGRAGRCPAVGTAAFSARCGSWRARSLSARRSGLWRARSLSARRSGLWRARSLSARRSGFWRPQPAGRFPSAATRRRGAR